jgi:hypothetical protein
MAMTVRHNLILITAVFTVAAAFAAGAGAVASAEPPSAQVRSGLLHDTFGGVLGDSWSPFIGLTGLATIKTSGQVYFEDENGDVGQTELSSPGSFGGQIGTYVSAVGESLHFSLGIGYYWSQINSDLGTAQFSRVSLEAVPYYQFGSQRVGLGIHQYLFSQLNMEDMGGDSIRLRSSTGGVVEYGYWLQGLRTWANLRYQYTPFGVAKDDRYALGRRIVDQAVGIGFILQFL